MSFADEKLIIGRGYAHQAAVITFATAATDYAATAASTYAANPGSEATFNGRARFVEVCNDSATDFLTVALGSSASEPEDATAGDARVYPRSSRTFQLPNDGTPKINVKADTATCPGAVIWYP